MPALLSGHRRSLMALLVLTAFANSGFAVVTGLLVAALLTQVGSSFVSILSTLGLLALALIGLAVTRYADRVLAEQLGQDYVQQIRHSLIRHAITSPKAPSLGVTIARATNDLASVRNWVSLGIAPLVAFVPLAGGSLIVLAVLEPLIAVGVAAPILLLGIVLATVSRSAFERACRLRRRRGSLAARVADTVTAATGITVAGGVDRELRALDRSGKKVVSAAVSRARTSGQMRAVALVVPVIGSAAAAGLAAFGLVSTASVGAALTIVGILAGPVGELGRVVEYRQNYKAARRIIAPLIVEPTVEHAAPAVNPSCSTGKRVVVSGIVLDGLAFPSFTAEPGDRIALQGFTSSQKSTVLSVLANAQPDGVSSICIDGRDLAFTGSKSRRRRVGYAGAGQRLERGTLSRAVRYRRPDLPEAAGSSALATVGMAEIVAALPDGERTMLRQGGDPLSRPEQARLLVARALLGEPPLLLLDHIDNDLGAVGTAMLKSLVDDYPGVVILASDRPAAVLDEWTAWGPHDSDASQLPVTTPTVTSTKPSS